MTDHKYDDLIGDVYRVSMRSSPERQEDGLIRTDIEVEADDDVDAAEEARNVAKERFPNRSRSTWRAERAEPVQEKSDAA